MSGLFRATKAKKFMAILEQAIDPRLSLAELLRAVQQGEISFGELRRILAQEDHTLVAYDSKSRAAAPLKIDRDIGAGAPPGHDLVATGSAYILGVKTPVIAYRPAG